MLYTTSEQVYIKKELLFYQDVNEQFVCKSTKNI